MIVSVIENRLTDYAPANSSEQENALQEIMQHYILASLSRAGLFRKAMFHGGTCLRIFFGTTRYSEDLDFLLHQSDPSFAWEEYLEKVRIDCRAEGIEFELLDKSKTETAVKKAFLKTDSIGKLIILHLPFERHLDKKIRIKLEIDTNPPLGSAQEIQYLTFPSIAPVTCQNSSSGFALKIHALLCRSYTKGRDWYDYIWYIRKKIKPNLELLRNALFQQGPWKNEALDITYNWVLKTLDYIVGETDWKAAHQDVERFVRLFEQSGLQYWNRDFFTAQTEALRAYIGLG